MGCDSPYEYLAKDTATVFLEMSYSYRQFKYKQYQYHFIQIKAAHISSTLYLSSLLQKEIENSVKNVKAEKLLSQTK